MKITGDSRKLKDFVSALRRKNRTVGFVPTMGYLHEGHLSLVRTALRENDAVVASIFVNPLQFGPKEDFRRYPRDLSRDAAMLKKEKTDFLFTPSAGQFYPEGFQTEVSVKKLCLPLCGRTRPTHFAGVTTVVMKLLNGVRPDRLYLGQKDYQQFRIIEQMVHDMDMPVEMKMAPIVREKDGLAMSSRNAFLTDEERAQAPTLRRALLKGEALVKKGVRDASRITRAMKETLREASLARPDYVEIADARTLSSVVRLMPGQKALLALAVYFGKTRLIDNILTVVK